MTSYDKKVMPLETTRSFGLEGLHTVVVAPDTMCRQEVKNILENRKFHRILVLTDVQLDFIPDPTQKRIAALPVPGADTKITEIVRILNEKPTFDLVVITCDNHPPHHSSFASNQSELFQEKDVIYSDGTRCRLTQWPVHCVQGSEGVKVHPSVVEALHALQKKLGATCPHIVVCPKG